MLFVHQSLAIEAPKCTGFFVAMRATFSARVTRGRDYYLISMLEEYQGESLGVSEAGGSQVHVAYASDPTRFQLRIEDHKLVDANGRPVSGSGIYKLDRQGRLLFTSIVEVGRVHHSSLSGGRAVAAAGQLQLHEGRVVSIDNLSGHFRPPAWLNWQVVDYLRAAGVEVPSEYVKFR